MAPGADEAARLAHERQVAIANGAEKHGSLSSFR
jgi:hypothetical protein